MKKVKVVYRMLIVMGIAVALLGIGCSTFQRAPVTKAVAVLRSHPDFRISGTITFIQEGMNVRVIVDASGLAPGKHGIHIHEFGDLSSPDFTSAGGHFNPGNKAHAAPYDMERHVGDLGNIEADKSGRVKDNFLDEKIALTGSNSIIGRSVIIKEKADDFTTQPGGGAGKRIAAGIIGISPLPGD